MPTKFVTNPRRPAAKKARPAAKKARVPMRRNYASIAPANNFLRDLRPAQVAQMVREGSLAVTHADIGNGYYTVTLFDDGVGGENRKRVEAKWFVDGEDEWYKLLNDITNGKVDPSTADLFLGPSRWDKREREEQTRAAAKRKGIDIDASRHYFNNPKTAAKATRAPSVASLSAKVVRLAKKHGPSHPLTVAAREEFEVAARAREGKRQSRMPVEAQMWAGMLAKRNPTTASGEVTPRVFLLVLRSKLTQHDAKLSAKQPNLYRLGHYLAAAERVEKAMGRSLDSTSPAALEKFKKSLHKAFEMPFAPASAVERQVDAYLAKGTTPSLVGNPRRPAAKKPASRRAAAKQPASRRLAGADDEALERLILRSKKEYIERVRAGEKNLGRVNLENARLAGIDLAKANLRGAILSGANLSKANLSEANIRYARIEATNLADADLRRADLEGSILYGSRLAGANLQGANLSYAQLREASLKGANLKGANLEGANLDGANLDGANLEGANIEGTILEKPRRKNPPKGFRIAGPAVKTMVDGLRISKADAQKLKDMMDTGAPRILQTADKMMNGHGVERISGVGGGLMYVNMGDTYDTTLIYDYKTNRFVVSSWGDIVERQPRRFAD